MIIVADRAIPFIRHYFADVAELRLVDGRGIDAGAVRDADVLVVRTITRVDDTLLEGSRVHFVATTASGIDHVDLDCLARRGIGFADAHGSNARAVAEYVLSALLVVTEEREQDPRGLTAGVVGFGAVGTQVAAFLDALGVTCLPCDPPLRESGSNAVPRDLDDLLDADLLTLHVPLTWTGSHATGGMVGAGLLSRMRDDVILINTARGGVVDETALTGFLGRHDAAAAVIDVWNGEPEIDPLLIGAAAIATPHIAGYSTDARMRATAAAARAVRSFIGADSEPAPLRLPSPAVTTVRIAAGEDPVEAARLAVLACYDVRADSVALKRIAQTGAPGRGAFFEELRNNYPVRREFSAHTVVVEGDDPGLGRMFRQLGFQVDGGGRQSGV